MSEILLSYELSYFSYFNCLNIRHVSSIIKNYINKIPVKIILIEKSYEKADIEFKIFIFCEEITWNENGSVSLLL